jgi:hypothetical protein
MRDKMNKKDELSAREQRVLETVGRLTIATTLQVNDCLYSKGSLTTTAAVLLSLFERRYLDRIPLRLTPRGNPRWVFKLKNRGHRYLTRKVGISPSDLIRPSDNLTSAAYPLIHALESNGLIVKALQMARTRPHLWVIFRSEPQLRHEYSKRAIRPDDPRCPLIPDCWLRILKDEGEGEAVFWVEIDRGTTPVSRLTAKLPQLVTIDSSPDYQAIFGTQLLIVVFVVTAGGERRISAILGALESYLENAGRRDQSDLFLVGSLEGESEADDLFFNPSRFRSPFADDPLSLLPASWFVKGRER